MYLFLCRYPYIQKVPLWKRPFVRHRFEEILPSDEGRYKEMERYVLIWMNQRGFFKSLEVMENFEKEYRCMIDLQNLTPKAMHYAATFNMRTLLDPEETRRLKGLLMDERNGRGATDLIHLIDTLVSLFPERILNTVITKLYRGVSSIVTQSDRWEEWVEYHAHNPYIWMVIYWNHLMNRYGDPRAMWSLPIPEALQGLVQPDR